MCHFIGSGHSITRRADDARQTQAEVSWLSVSLLMEIVVLRASLPSNTTKACKSSGTCFIMADVRSKGKRKRVNDDSNDESDGDGIHEDHRRDDRTRWRDCSSQKTSDRISARGETRMHVGDHYGDVNIHQSGAGPASGSKSAEPDAIESALEGLMFDEQDSRYLTISNSLPSTCNWLFERKEFCRWQDVSRIHEHHGFFWIKGKAGAGKSTLVKYTCQKAKKNSKEHGTVVSFFFNARGAPIEKSLEGMFRSLLYQLFDKFLRL